MGWSDRVSRILKKENRRSTRQSRVLEKAIRHRPSKKSVRSAAGRVLSAAAGESGLAVDWTALVFIILYRMFVIASKAKPLGGRGPPHFVKNAPRVSSLWGYIPEMFDTLTPLI